MKNISRSFGIVITLVLIIVSSGISQSRTRRSKRPKKIKKNVIIELEPKFEKKNKAFLQSYRGEELVLQIQGAKLKDNRNYTQTTIQLDNFDYIRIKDRKQTFRKSLISGLLVGTASFFIVRGVSKSGEQTNLSPIGQDPSSGNIEGFLASGLGFGLGLVLYDGIANQKLNIEDNKREVMKKLKKVKL